MKREIVVSLSPGALAVCWTITLALLLTSILLGCATSLCTGAAWSEDGLDFYGATLTLGPEDAGAAFCGDAPPTESEALPRPESTSAPRA